MLSAYSYRELQLVSTVLMAAQAQGMAIDTVVATVRAAMESRGVAAATTLKEAAPEVVPCPTPGCAGSLVAWPMSSRLVGARVVGCVRCHHSEVRP